MKPYEDFYKQHSFTAKTKHTSVMAECRACARARTKARYHGEKHDEIRKKDNLSVREKRAKIKDIVFAAYGGYKCVCCGETEPMFLTIDHINNDGAKHRRQISGKRHMAGYHTYKWLMDNNFPDGFQVLCMNCNHGKRMNNGICPHQVRRNDYPEMGVEPSGSKRIAPQVGEDIV